MLTEVSGNSKKNVRCCSPNGDSCQSCEGDSCKRRSEACKAQKGKTFEEAENICSSRGLRLCSPDELDICCGTGCWFNRKLVWVADEPQVKGE